MNKEQAAAWYGRVSRYVRWVGYQGSDMQFHYFIARSTEDWRFIRISRTELTVEDERPFLGVSSPPPYHSPPYSPYYYLVDPSRDYQKIAVKNTGEPSGSANRSQPVGQGTNRAPSAAGSGG